jgi:hypothetical protein
VGKKVTKAVPPKVAESEIPPKKIARDGQLRSQSGRQIEGEGWRLFRSKSKDHVGRRRFLTRDDCLCRRYDERKVEGGALIRFVKRPAKRAIGGASADAVKPNVGQIKQKFPTRDCAVERRCKVASGAKDVPKVKLSVPYAHINGRPVITDPRAGEARTPALKTADALGGIARKLEHRGVDGNARDDPTFSANNDRCCLEREAVRRAGDSGTTHQNCRVFPDDTVAFDLSLAFKEYAAICQFLVDGCTDLGSENRPRRRRDDDEEDRADRELLQQRPIASDAGSGRPNLFEGDTGGASAAIVGSGMDSSPGGGAGAKNGLGESAAAEGGAEDGGAIAVRSGAGSGTTGLVACAGGR